MEKKVVLGIILGDHAGSSPEMVAKAVLANEETYIPVLTGNLERFCISCQHVAGADRLDIRPLDGRPLEGGANVVYFCDVPAGPDIHFSTVTKDSGRLQYDSMEKMMELERAGIVDGYSMAPITKAGFHAAGLDFSSEFEVFAKFYGVPKCASVIKCENIFRSTVVGHCAFREIVERLTPDGIVDTAHALLDTMAIFLGRENCRIGLGCECSTLPTAYHATTMSDFYHYEHGYRARDGFLITKAAEKGIHNQRDALDCPRCYTAVICGDAAKSGSGSSMDAANESDETWLTRDLGKRYLIMETLLKHWPANMWVQTPVEIVSDLAKAHGFGPEDVEEIIIDPPIVNRMWAPDEGFSSVTHAQFSAPYVIATMLYHPTPGAYWYSPEMMKDPKIIALAKRVKAGPSKADSPMTDFGKFRNGSYPMKTVTVKLKNGETYQESMDCHPGHPKNMMTREQFVERFRVQASPVLQDERLEKAIETLCNIEQVEDISAVCGLLG